MLVRSEIRRNRTNRPVDPLSDVLSLLKPRTYVTGGLSAGGPWSIHLPAYDGIKCYAIAAGECWLTVEGVDEPVKLRPGNCVLLPHGRPFVLASDLALPPVDARALVSTVERYNGVLSVSPGDDCFVLGSHFALEGDARFLLDVLPPIVVLKDEAHQESIRWAIERMLREMRDFQPGGTLVAQQVAYTLLVGLLVCTLQMARSEAPVGSSRSPTSAWELRFRAFIRVPLMPGRCRSSLVPQECHERPSPRPSRGP
jgi:hypothetical protein